MSYITITVKRKQLPVKCLQPEEAFLIQGHSLTIFTFFPLDPEDSQSFARVSFLDVDKKAFLIDVETYFLGTGENCFCHNKANYLILRKKDGLVAQRSPRMFKTIKTAFSILKP
jgi:hypothetical protein